MHVPNPTVLHSLFIHKHNIKQGIGIKRQFRAFQDFPKQAKDSIESVQDKTNQKIN